MKAIKFKDTAGNVNYVKGDAIKVQGSLVKASIGNNPYKGMISYMFFHNYTDLQIWLEQNPDKILIGKGCLSTGLHNGNSRDNHLYEITDVTK